MSKKLSFKNISKSSVATLNECNSIIFASAYEKKALSLELKGLKSDFEALENPTEKQCKDYEKACNVIATKRSNLNAWTKTSLQGNKEVDGLYKALGVTDVMIALNDGSYNKVRDAITMSLKTYFDLDSSLDKLVVKLASQLAFAVSGEQSSTQSATLKGNLLKSRSNNDLVNTYVRALSTYASKTCDSIIIPEKEHYKAVFTYAKDSLNVVDYKVVELSDEELCA